MAVKVHVVQMHDGKHSGVRAPSIQVQLDVDAFKFVCQTSRNQPPRPLVKVTYHQPRVFQVWGHQQFAAHQHVRLPPPLQVPGPQMDVEDMDDFPRHNFNVATDAPARLAARGGEIVDLRLLYGKAAEHDVAVSGAP